MKERSSPVELTDVQTVSSVSLWLLLQAKELLVGWMV